MGGSEADPLDAGHIRHRGDEACEIPVFEPVGIHILPKQGNLFVALCRKVLNLPNDPLGSSGSFPSARVGHDAERTEVIASAHHRDPCGDPRGLLGHDVLIGLVFGEINGDASLDLA